MFESQAGLVVVDSGGRLQALDGEAEALLGGVGGELLDRSLEELLEGDSPGSLLEALQAGALCPLRVKEPQGAPRSVTARMRAGTKGPLRMIELRGGAPTDPVFNEVPESRRVLATLLSNLPGMVYRCQNDADWTMVFVSEGCQALTGYRPEDLHRNRTVAYADLIHPEDREAVWDQVQSGLETRSPFRLTYRIRTASGAEKWVWEQGRGIFSPEGALLFLEGFITDISDRVQAERALRESEEHLRRARQMEALGRLAGGVAHDFNNLLTAITGHAEAMLQELPRDSLLRPRVTSVLRAVDRGAALTLRLLARGRPGAGPAPVEDLHQVVRELRFLLEALVGPGVTVDIDLEPGPAPVRIDRLQFEQVLMNLALNARDALPEGGRFRVGSGRRAVPEGDLPAGSYLCLQVADTGVGMTPEVARRAFEPFFTTKEVGRGTGLGLYSAYGIVQAYGGSILLESAPGDGTTFTLLLPLEETAPVASPEDGGPLRGGSETILLAEDEDLLRELARESLTRKGYRVLEARDGQEALDIVRRTSESVALLITDVLMPRMGGVELAARLRQELPDLRVLMVSGYASEARPLLSDRMALIEKPFRTDVLLRKVRAMLDERGDRP